MLDKNIDKSWYIYCHTNKVNGKKYVGITCKKNPNQRWNNGRGYKPNVSKNESDSIFYRAILKYGWDNFEHEILRSDVKTLEEANNLESYYIKKYNSCVFFKNSNGYNMTLGGDGTKGHPISDVSKIKIGNANKNIHKRGNSGMSKKVFYDGIIFECAEDCCEYIGIDVFTLRSYLRRDRKVPKDIFLKGLRYLEEDFKPNKEYKINKYKKIICGGKIYNKVSELSEEYNIKYDTLLSYLSGKNGIQEPFLSLGLTYVGEEPIKTKQKKARKIISVVHSNKQVICDDKIYISIKECSKEYKIKDTTMSKWLTGKNNMPQKFIDLGLKYLDNPMEYNKKITKHKVVLYNGVEYSCIKDLSTFLGVPPTTLSSYLNNKRKTPKYLLDGELKFKKGD